VKKRILGIALIVAMLASLLVGSTVLAADPTEVTTTWSGSGSVGVTVNTGDTTAGVITEGSGISGSYTTKDSNDNPYGYGVDTFTAYLNASVEDGYIDTGSERLTSKESMYGAPGQTSWSFVVVDDGTASMAYRTWTNYASLKDPSYGYQLSGGHNIIADADAYLINRGVQASDGTNASTLITGSGTAVLDNMVSEASATGVRLGWGGGCYTDANFSATGTGTFTLSATGDTSATTAMAPGMVGASSFTIVANWASSFSIADYSVTAQ